MFHISTAGNSPQNDDVVCIPTKFKVIDLKRTEHYDFYVKTMSVYIKRRKKIIRNTFARLVLQKIKMVLISFHDIIQMTNSIE